MTGWFVSFVFVVGLASITYGAWKLNDAAGWIVGGVLVCIFAWFFRRSGFDGPTGPTDQGR